MNAEHIAALIDGLRGLPYDGEAVDQRTHALQAAGHAIAAGGDDELVVAAALHDIGRAAPVRAAYPGLPHEEAGAAFAREQLGERVAWIIAAHVPAKRYLVATDPAYRAQLSPTSIRTLAQQGGDFTPEQAREFATHPWAADATALRRWDDAAKDPAAPGADLSVVLEAYERLTGR
ncbi:MAG TPA: HD domain-containing protein [Mycobacteriales bacterium]|nr:HD domain-containing protein [Mycobacteriales bacterium]